MSLENMFFDRFEIEHRAALYRSAGLSAERRASSPSKRLKNSTVKHRIGKTFNGRGISDDSIG
jgi:hypothetical protein